MTTPDDYPESPSQPEPVNHVSCTWHEEPLSESTQASTINLISLPSHEFKRVASVTFSEHTGFEPRDDSVIESADIYEEDLRHQNIQRYD